MTQLEKLKKDYQDILINWIDKDYDRRNVSCEIVYESDKFAVNFLDWYGGLRLDEVEGKTTKELLEIYKLQPILNSFGYKVTQAGI